MSAETGLQFIRKTHTIWIRNLLTLTHIGNQVWNIKPPSRELKISRINRTENLIEYNKRSKDYETWEILLQIYVENIPEYIQKNIQENIQIYRYNRRNVSTNAKLRHYNLVVWPHTTQTTLDKGMTKIRNIEKQERQILRNNLHTNLQNRDVDKNCIQRNFKKIRRLLQIYLGKYEQHFRNTFTG